MFLSGLASENGTTTDSAIRRNDMVLKKIGNFFTVEVVWG